MQDSLFGDGTAAESPAATATSPDVTASTVYYVTSGGTSLYDAPRGRVVAQLAEFQKVERFGMKNGYAQVRVEATGASGWVDNAKLIWRLPSRPNAVPETPPAERLEEDAATAAEESGAGESAPASPPAEPAAAAVEATEPPPAPAPVPAAAINPAPTQVNPSVFDPY